MRAYLIDTPNKQVIEVDYNGDFRTIKEHLRCELFTTVVVNDAGDTLFVDDEGLINGNPHGWIAFEHMPGALLRGYGLLLGTDHEGASIAPVAPIEWLRELVRFPGEDTPAPDTRQHVRGFDTVEEMFDALFGPNWR